MDDAKTTFVWVFSGGYSGFPGGVFQRIEAAEAWIASHQLSGVLTQYPLDEGCFDWAVRTGEHGMSEKTLAKKRADREFIAGFASGTLQHFHYEDGQRK